MQMVMERCDSQTAQSNIQHRKSFCEDKRDYFGFGKSFSVPQEQSFHIELTNLLISGELHGMKAPDYGLKNGAGGVEVAKQGSLGTSGGSGLGSGQAGPRGVAADRSRTAGARSGVASGRKWR